MGCDPPHLIARERISCALLNIWRPDCKSGIVVDGPRTHQI
jgi:hypothetical protein